MSEGYDLGKKLDLEFFEVSAVKFIYNLGQAY